MGVAGVHSQDVIEEPEINSSVPLMVAENGARRQAAANQQLVDPVCAQHMVAVKGVQSMVAKNRLNLQQSIV